MEEKVIKIEVPEGFEVDRLKSTFEKIVFKPINKDVEWETFGKIKGYFLDSSGHILNYENDHTHCNNKNTFPTREEIEACLALSQLLQWRDKYNGQKLSEWCDWSDGNQIKFVIYYNDNKIKLTDTLWCSEVLAFKSEEIRDKFFKDFKELIEIAKPLL